MTRTADLYDAHVDRVQVAQPIFADFGGVEHFEGIIATVKVFEDNSLVRSTLECEGTGKVLVIDGGGSLRCALVGDQIGALAQDNGWHGLIVYGCIRDSQQLCALPIGIKALGACPAKSAKRSEGQPQLPVRLAGTTFTPGHYLWADSDGILVASTPLP